MRTALSKASVGEEVGAGQKSLAPSVAASRDQRRSGTPPPGEAELSERRTRGVHSAHGCVGISSLPPARMHALASH